MKIVLLGAAGQVGAHLFDVLSPVYDVRPVTRAEVDLADTDRLAGKLEPLEADLVVNAAAYTAVDRAETEQDLASRVNAIAPGIVAEHCSSSGIPFIHFSTDYVFDGSSDRPYKESDMPAPSGIYGKTKLAGEQAVMSAHKPAIILRTSWVYSWRGSNFYRTMLRLAGERDELNVVADQVGAPTYSGSIARATAQLVQQLRDHGGFRKDQSGVFHFTCAGQTNWCEFARRILRRNGKENIRVNAITTEDYPTPAVRPAYSALDNARLLEVFDVALPGWESALEHCVRESQKG